MAHGDAQEGKWRGNWRMEWLASTLKLPRNVVYPALLTLMRTPRLPAVDWSDDPSDLDGLVRFGERRNLVSARVPSRFKRTIPYLNAQLSSWRWTLGFYTCRSIVIIKILVQQKCILLVYVIQFYYNTRCKNIFKKLNQIHLPSAWKLKWTGHTTVQW